MWLNSQEEREETKELKASVTKEKADDVVIRPATGRDGLWPWAVWGGLEQRTLLKARTLQQLLTR